MATNRDIDLQLAEISKKISFFVVNPINEEEEKKKFFRSKTYEPKFRYDAYKENIKKLQQELTEVSPDNTELGQLLKQSRNIEYTMLNMLKHRGTDKFTKYSILCYGLPDKELVHKAKEILEWPSPKENDAELSTEEIIRRMNSAFLRYGFKWTIKEKDMAATAAVKNCERELLIRRNSRFSKKVLDRLIVHEIGTHILRADNGSLQPYKIFERGLPNYLMTEEGLAVYNEEKHDCLDVNVLKRYAARVVAVDMSSRYGFRRVFNFLCRYIDEDLAWRTTVRAKRGLKDTSLPGGCTKDFAYLRGYYAVKKYMEDGGDISKLYYGKVGIQHVEILDKIPDLIEPGILPPFRYMKFFMESVGSFVRNLVFVGNNGHEGEIAEVKDSVRGESE